MSEITSFSIKETHEKLKSKEFSSVELVKAYFDRIKKYDEKLNAFVLLSEEYALKRAVEIDKEHHFETPLTGIPCALKDVFCSLESPSTASSHILDNYKAPYESTTVKRLKNAGAIMLGKVNTDEFTMGSSTESSYYGPTRNPWDTERVAGGSSGGSAASVIADLCGFAMGTDTGGSIRQPAALCGVVGLKVTYGRTSRFGVMSMTSCLDTIGPLTKTVEDAAIVLKYIAGRDRNDSTTPDVPVPDYQKTLTKDLKGLKVGIPKQFFIKGLNKEIEEAVYKGIDVLKTLGAEVMEVSLPNTKYSLPVYYGIAPIEVSSNMARYDGIRFGLKQEESKNILDHYFKLRSRGFGKEVKRRIIIGTYIHSLGYDGAYYIKAQKVRSLLKKDAEEAFKKVDIMVCPTTPNVAFKIGSKGSTDPVEMYLQDIFTTTCSLAGMPAISIPCGFNSEGLPIGIQFMGTQFGEETVLKTAYAYEQATEWHKRKPEL